MKIAAIYWALAYGGMVLHLLMKLMEDQKSSTFLFSTWIEKNLMYTIISIIMIPMLLYASMEPIVQQYLPLNNITSVLIGFQTQDIFRTLTLVFKIKKK